MNRNFLFALVALLAVACHVASAQPVVAIQTDPSVSPAIVTRLITLIEQSVAGSYPVLINPFSIALLPSGSMVLSFGPTSTTRMLIPGGAVAQLRPEGYIIKSSAVSTSAGYVTVFATDGVPPNRKVTDVFPKSYPLPNTGLNFGCYALLEQLGFAFLHPLEPFVPLPPMFYKSSLSITSSPRWPIRGWHYHTEHPLELTNYLNGWGYNTTDDEAGWKQMQSDWTLFLEWLVANRQNSIEYLLLAADEWESFVASPERQQRMNITNTMAQAWGIAVAADVPIAIRQQHAWYMTDGEGTMEHQVQQIQDRIDWLHKAGFHFLSTESGFSEFTHPDCSVMVAWMNATAEYARNKYGWRTFIKAHISTGQFCPNYADPTTGVPPCNFNYLPHYATPELGVLAHTVQMYTFDDPAPTYGQTNFQNMYEFTLVEAPHRYTLYHGETAYWVNYDIDVPLFLPYYAYGRLYDLRKLARAEDARGIRLMGQFNFESGWEWGYWLQNSLTARAAWDPKSTSISDQDALKQSIADVSHFLGPVAPAFNDWFVNYVNLQHDLLVLGLINGTAPSSVVKRNGIAYLEGWDTWAQLMPVAGLGTQPLNLDIASMHTDSGQQFYASSVRPLLTEMSTRFKASMSDLRKIVGQVPGTAMDYYLDIFQSALMTSTRADFVLAIYDSMWTSQSAQWRKTRLGDAITSLKIAQQVVETREASYRVPLERVAGWGRNTNPTAYDYGFLWTVHSLFYWFRDLYRSMNTFTSIDPCFLNIIDPARVAFGDGTIAEFEHWLAEYLKSHGLASLAHCLSPPVLEPHYDIPAFPPQ